MPARLDVTLYPLPVAPVHAGQQTGPQAGQPCLTRTDRPPDNYGRATVHLRWPHPVWASPTETAAYLAHEATHVYRYHQDQYTWADEAAPTSVEFVVRWALRSTRQAQAGHEGAERTGQGFGHGVRLLSGCGAHVGPGIA